MKIGIVGLPNVGKSSLFNMLTHAHAQVAKFPFTTIDRNVGMVFVPDERLERIVEITKAPKMKYAQIEFVDIAGLIKGASQGDGLGNKFLAHIRDVDLVLHILRCFADEDIPHTDDKIIPRRDYDIVRTELLLSDLVITERRIEKVKKRNDCKEECIRLQAIHESLSHGSVPDRTMPDLPLISVKKEMIVMNMDEAGGFTCDMDGYKLSVKLEQDIMDFSEDEKRELREDAGVDTQGLPGLIATCLQTLSIILFYTVKGEETRAWPVARGTTICDAAGKIHTDMKDGFIKAEVLGYEDFITMQGFTAAQHAGKTHIEGKDYLVQDGDIVLIKFRPK
jgi:small GTP-binding protein